MPIVSSSLRKHLISDLPCADDVLPYLKRLDETRWYTNFGILSREMEGWLESLLNRVDETPQYGSINVISVCSGYHALEIGLQMLGVKTGSRVLVPSVTFPACPLAVQHVGASPILADVDSTTWTLTPQIASLIAKKLTYQLVMPVAVYGVPLPIVEWNDFYTQTGIPLLIDAAAAIETQQIPKSGLVVHSMHATKPLGIGEGGLLVSRDKAMIDRVRMHENFGTDLRISYVDGINGKMSEYHAAVGLAQCQRWEQIKQSRRKVLSYYQKNLTPLKADISLQPHIDLAVPSVLMLRFTMPIADRMFDYLLSQDIAVHRTYLPPLYRHPYFGNLETISTDATTQVKEAGGAENFSEMPASEEMHAHMIGVPFHPFLDKSDVETVCFFLKTGLSALRAS